MTLSHRPEAAIEPVAHPNGRVPASGEPEAPQWATTLANALHELTAILPGLRLALERQAHPVELPLAYRKSGAAKLCGISVRLLERLSSAGKFPRPDAFAGRCPLFRRETLQRWLSQGGSSK
jgi:hypothetical protein